MIASFATKQFSVSNKQIHTFTNFSFESKLNTEKLENTGKKPSTNIKGEDLDSFKLSLPLSVECLVSPQKEINDWKAILSNKIPYLFILGSKQFGKNKFLLTSISVNDTDISINGAILSCVMELSFEEYVRAGIPKEKTTTQTSPGIANKTTNNVKVSSYNEDEKAHLKKQFRPSVAGERVSRELLDSSYKKDKLFNLLIERVKQFINKWKGKDAPKNIYNVISDLTKYVKGFMKGWVNDEPPSDRDYALMSFLKEIEDVVNWWEVNDTQAKQNFYFGNFIKRVENFIIKWASE